VPCVRPDAGIARLPAAAADLESAIRKLPADTEIRTPDAGGASKISEVTDGVIAEVKYGSYTPHASG
jgi:isocitrate/isopropylmalate dehydrogenase